MTYDYSATLDIMKQTAKRAGKGLVRDFSDVANLKISIKAPRDFVSIADTNAEKSIIADLKKAYPDYGIVGEESGTVVHDDNANANSDHIFYIDPLDGTTNFLYNIPYFSVCINLEYRGEVVAGVVYDPIRDEMFSAILGKGAYLNDKPIRVSGREDIADCIFVTGVMPTPERIPVAQREQKAVLSGGVAVRNMGSAALDLCWVGAGRFDGQWHHDLSPWDCAAGMIVVREAGGTVTNLHGADYNVHKDNCIVASNTGVHKNFLAALYDAQN